MKYRSSDVKLLAREHPFVIFWVARKSQVMTHVHQTAKLIAGFFSLLSAFSLTISQHGIVLYLYSTSHSYDVQVTNKAIFGDSQSCPRLCNGSSAVERQKGLMWATRALIKDTQSCYSVHSSIHERGHLPSKPHGFWLSFTVLTFNNG